MNVKVFTDNDLDGACSALLLAEVHKNDNISITEIIDATFYDTVKAWAATNINYDVVYVTDLFVPDSVLPLLDNKKVVIIDHHKSHIDVKDRYKEAKVVMKEETSCSKLIYELFAKKLTHLKPSHKRLVDIVDDYDCYQLKYADTLKLNAVYRGYNRPRVDRFIESFKSGMREYTAPELGSINIFFKKLKAHLEDVQMYHGEIKGNKVISFFCDFAINEVAHFLLKKTGAQVAIIVMPRIGAVSFRKRDKNCDIKLNKLAEILCEGGGHEYAAGGKITDKFLEFTKLLKPYESN